MPTRSCAITALAAVALVLGGTGCSGDDETATAADTTAATATDASSDASDLTEFCALAAELAGTSPTKAQIDEYAALAPGQISAPVEVFVAAFSAAEGDLGRIFSDPVVVAASDEISAFEFAECGITPPGPPDGAGG